MVRKQVMVIHDDLDGEEIAINDVRNFRFSVEGVNYSMDLRDETYDQAMTMSLTDLIEKASREKGRRTRGSGPAPTGANRTRAIREWAGENGYTVSEKGRVPKTVVEAYDMAHG